MLWRFGIFFSLLCSMKSMFLSDSHKETQVHDFNPQSWLQVERGKLSKVWSYSPSSIESLIKIVEPPILPYFKTVDYVGVLAQIHEELEQCKPEEQPDHYLLQCHIFRGLGETKMLQRSLHSAWKHANTVHEKLFMVLGCGMRSKGKSSSLTIRIP